MLRLLERDGLWLRSWDPARGMSLPSWAGLLGERALRALLLRSAQAALLSSDAIAERHGGCTIAQLEARDLSTAALSLDPHRVRVSWRCSRLCMHRSKMVGSLRLGSASAGGLYSAPLGCCDDCALRPAMRQRLQLASTTPSPRASCVAPVSSSRARSELASRLPSQAT